MTLTVMPPEPKTYWTNDVYPVDLVLRSDYETLAAVARMAIAGRDKARAILADVAMKSVAMENEYNKLSDERDGLLELSRGLDEHPDEYDGPCMCKTCLSYGTP